MMSCVFRKGQRNISPALMYRPDAFYTVNQTVWPDYPSADDGCDIPPMNLPDGYGVAGRYFITPVNP